MTGVAHRAAPQLPGNAPEIESPNGGAPTLDAVLDMTDYLKTLANPKALSNQKELVAAYDKAVNDLIGENDVQAVKERGELKYFKKKSAWKKLARYFRIDVREKSHRVYRDEKGETIAEVTMIGIAPWGQQVEELGACTTYETRFKSDAQKAKGWHDCLATAQTRASNRAISALIAAGEVSAEEVEQQRGGEQHDVARFGTFPYGPQKGMAVTADTIGLGLLVKAIRWAMKDDDRMAQFEEFIAAAWQAIPSKVAVCPDDELRTIAAWAADPKQEGVFDALAKECADAIHARGLDHQPKDATTGTALEGQKDEEAAQLEAKLNPEPASADPNAPAPAASSASPVAAGAHDPSTTTSSNATNPSDSANSPKSTATSHAETSQRSSTAGASTTDPLAARRAQLKARVSHPACATIRTIVEARLTELTEAEIDDQMTMAADIISAYNVTEAKKDQGRRGMAARKANEAKRAGAEPDDAGNGDDERASWDA